MVPAFLCQVPDGSKSGIELWTPVIVATLGALVSLGVAWWGWRRERENRVNDRNEANAARVLTERLALTERRFQTASSYERELQSLISRLLAVEEGKLTASEVALGPFLQATAEMRLAFDDGVNQTLDKVEAGLRESIHQLEALDGVDGGDLVLRQLTSCRALGDEVRSLAKSEIYGRSLPSGTS